MVVASFPARPKVLVVDDEQIIANTLAQILDRHGFETAVAYGGQQAVVTAESWNPDILLIDVIMAEMNGVEAAVSVSERLPRCRILLTTGHTDTGELLRWARGLGHEFEVLTKPFHPELLVRRLRA